MDGPVMFAPHPAIRPFQRRTGKLEAEDLQRRSGSIQQTRSTHGEISRRIPRPLQNEMNPVEVRLPTRGINVPCQPTSAHVYGFPLPPVPPSPKSSTTSQPVRRISVFVNNLDIQPVEEKRRTRRDIPRRCDSLLPKSGSEADLTILSGDEEEDTRSTQRRAKSAHANRSNTAAGRSYSLYPATRAEPPDQKPPPLPKSLFDQKSSSKDLYSVLVTPPPSETTFPHSRPTPERRKNSPPFVGALMRLLYGDPTLREAT